MKLDDTKQLLKDLRSKRRQYLSALGRVQLLSETITSIGLTASYEAEGVKSSALDSPTERAVMRLLEAKERLEKLVGEYLDIEDRIAAALDSLTDEEREVVVETYMNSKTIAQISSKMFVSASTAKRRLWSGQKKISEKI
nr:MAG TPA: RNA polymerase sigma factor [Caudoviricetes sp.]